MGPTLYDVLGTERSASHEALRQAFRDRARAMHPDHGGGGAGCSAGMVAVNAAWETLGDPERRRVYDESLARPRLTAPATILATTHEVRMLRGLVAATVVLMTAMTVVFTLIAFAQSG
jgi:curved DNA-binding protein CbpA